jgi:hypothetical protein
VDWSSGRRGCAILLVLIAVLVGVFVYFGWQSRGETPSPSQGYLPPGQSAPSNRT